VLQSLPDFATILATLDANHVRFVLIGGLAMIAQGSDHRTQDSDVCYARDTDNLKALSSAIAPYKPRLRGVSDDVPFHLDVFTFKNTLNFTLETSLGAVYLLGEVAGIESFQGLWERSQTLELYDVVVHVASLDDLIAMKRAAGRLKDQLHLIELEELRQLPQEDTDANG
jgi:hypothetical protein